LAMSCRLRPRAPRPSVPLPSRFGESLDTDNPHSWPYTSPEQDTTERHGCRRTRSATPAKVPAARQDHPRFAAHAAAHVRASDARSWRSSEGLGEMSLDHRDHDGPLQSRDPFSSGRSGGQARSSSSPRPSRVRRRHRVGLGDLEVTKSYTGAVEGAGLQRRSHYTARLCDTRRDGRAVECGGLESLAGCHLGYRRAPRGTVL